MHSGEKGCVGVGGGGGGGGKNFEQMQSSSLLAFAHMSFSALHN